MLKDSQFSHILILLVLGYLIFYLTCPETKVAEKEPVMSSEPTGVYEGFASDQDDQENFGAHDDEDHEDHDHEDVDEETEVEVPEITDLSAEEPESSKIDESTTEFQPNVDSEDGADVKVAFDRAVPKGVDTNAIDFNKNVLKKYDSKAYLPQEINDKWFDTDFTQAKFKMNNDKLINTDKYVIGVDTVGQSLKNATWDLRGTIANPKYAVSPWNNSTYEPDYNLKALC
jgi:hypothetical protein